MRPLRVEMEGFSAFRAPTTVDFTDTDLFAFVGPTGAGKSSVIDAMVFALYGSVPRYGSDRLVHPVITQGKPEARIRFDFELGGVTYTVARVVRRTKTGATTKEARLERRDGDGAVTVLADDARGVTDAAVELLGLDLQQFTKCVVLPQGAFAALLHDTAGSRQDLLVKLLDFGVYERVAAAARQRATAAQQRMAILDGQLEQLAGATDEAIAAASRKLVAATTLLDQIDATTGAVAALDERERAAGEQLAILADRSEALDATTAPDGLDGLDDLAAAARDAAAAVEAADTAEATSRRAVEAETASRAALGDPAELRRLLAAHDDIVALRERVDKGQRTVHDHAAELERCRADASSAQEAEQAAAGVLERARLDHAAADLARHLHAGDDCPVCGSTVTELPTTDARELSTAEQAHADARRAARAAADALGEAERAEARYQTLLDGLAAQLEERQAAVADAPPAAALRTQLDDIATADEALVSAKSADDEARNASARARERRDDVAGREARARAAYTQVRDRLAALGPPPATDDLAGDWRRLTSWSDEQRAAVAEHRATFEAERAAAAAERAELVRSLVGAAEAAGIPAPRATVAAVRDATVRAAADAEQTRDRLTEARDRAVVLRDERADLAERREIHDVLAGELHPKRFEAWLLEEALAALVDGASHRLEQLSSGRYAMALDDKQAFEVIDHANADERRLARTLSGGETFLASLALALALAERVADLSPGGGASLDAIFLDEGFGTLDPETLDVVASAIEELGARGRMVGVVSHVRELAERVPTRFEVRRGPDTSTVERVDV